MKKIILLLTITILALFITGCWDMQEINQVLLPYSIAIDLNEGEGERYIITITYPNINAIGKNASQEERIHVVATIASSLFEGAQQLSTRLPYPFDFRMLKVLVLGKSISEDPGTVREIIDGMNRDFSISKKVRIIQAEGDAKDILLFIPNAKRQEVVEGTLFSMLSERTNTARYTPITLTDFVRDIDLGGVAVTPRVAVGVEDIKFFGGSIFKNYKFIGHLDEVENRALTILKGRWKRDLVVAPFKDITISFITTGSQLKRQFIKDKDNLRVKLNIRVEGALEEYIHTENPTLNDTRLIDEMQKAIEKQLMKEITETLELLQKEYKADAIGIGEYISKFHPRVWKEISEDWDEIFSDMDIEVSLEIKIRRRGLVK